MSEPSNSDAPTPEDSDRRTTRLGIIAVLVAIVIVIVLFLVLSQDDKEPITVSPTPSALVVEEAGDLEAQP